jgi:hypothetical protein
MYIAKLYGSTRTEIDQKKPHFNFVLITYVWNRIYGVMLASSAGYRTNEAMC